MLLKIYNLTLGYDRHPAVHHLTVDIPAGAMVALVGPNGAGKSTLLKGIMGQLKPLGGTIEFNGISWRDMAYLPQQTRIDWQFPMTVREMAKMGLWHKAGALGQMSIADEEQVYFALAQTGMIGFEDRLIGTLSGGQMQRLLFSRLILQDAQLLLLDEPFNAIDSATAEVLLGLLHAWHAEGKTILTVWHDLAGVKAHFPYTLFMARELVDFGLTPQVLSSSKLAESIHWQAAFDEEADVCEE